MTAVYKKAARYRAAKEDGGFVDEYTQYLHHAGSSTRHFPNKLLIISRKQNPFLMHRNDNLNTSHPKDLPLAMLHLYYRLQLLL